jgi:hypothetical protein
MFIPKLVVDHPTVMHALLQNKGDALAAHNKYRYLHQMDGLVWDDDAALAAQSWVFAPAPPHTHTLLDLSQTSMISTST